VDFSSQTPLVSVVLPTRDPNLGRLRATLDGLAAQTLPRNRWQLHVIDNGSSPSLESVARAELMQLAADVIVESQPGLTPARLAGIRAASGETIVFVDDDNILDPGYLAAVVRRFSENPTLGAAGGPVVPSWESPPPAWTTPFHGLLALRERTASIEIAIGGKDTPWPAFAPVGAGMAVRRPHANAYAEAVSHDSRRFSLDRSGGSLASGGDNDLIFTALHAGGDVGYFPELRVTHLIPAARFDATYLARLNRGVMRTWVRVLALHGQCPWPAIAKWTVPLRYARAKWRCRSEPRPSRTVTLAGLLGQFEGQADISARA
jgi:glycosyltransferase involved in cell wall biosynthesis